MVEAAGVEGGVKGEVKASDEGAAAGKAQVVTRAKKGMGKWVAAGVVGVVVLGVGVGWFVRSMGVVSTDDAYVNGHVTFVAARVAGQVARVGVDDNNRVRKGDVLVELDREPFEVKVKIAEAGVTAAESDLVTALAQARAQTALTRSARFNLDNAIAEVDNRIELLKSRVATLSSQKAVLDKADGDYQRAVPLSASGAMTREEFEQRKEAQLVAEARYKEALQGVYQVRVSLGLPATPEKGDDLTQVPDHLDETFSTVRQAQAIVIQQAAALGVTDSMEKAPRQMIKDFQARDPEGNIDRIYAELIKNAPAVKQAEAKLEQAKRAVDEARLNLKYTEVVAEIDGVVTRRNVNAGNNVAAGQSLMAVRSLTEIWVDANFKETQIGKLKIGQAVDLDVDMYGRHQVFKGRISGFTMGTGSTLAILPAQNATGNFVKVVQRLPVRIEVLDYDAEKAPLFIGLSVEPKVRLKEPLTGPHAGAVLQPYVPAETQPAGTGP